MNERTLRLSNEHKETAVQSIAPSTEEMQKVDQFAKMHGDVSAIKARHKQELGVMEKQTKSLLEELKELARERGTTQLVGVRHVVSFQPTSSRTIDPKALYEYLVKNGRESEFWDLVSVGLTKAMGNYGERALESAELIQLSSDPYGKVSTSTRPIQ